MFATFGSNCVFFLFQKLQDMNKNKRIYYIHLLFISFVFFCLLKRYYKYTTTFHLFES